MSKCTLKNNYTSHESLNNLRRQRCKEKGSGSIEACLGGPAATVELMLSEEQLRTTKIYFNFEFIPSKLT